MATDKNFVDFIVETTKDLGLITSRKMFGSYMIYVNDKPLLLVCDNIIFVKMKDEIKDLMTEAETGFPYDGARLHYILDIENQGLVEQVIPILEEITPFPKPKKKK